jgi:hypothetical protein
MKKRILALLMVLCMVMSLLSVTAWAADGISCDKGESCTDHVAEAGGLHYATLADAVAGAESGATITMLNGTELSSSVRIPQGKTLTLDLNGKTITGTSKNDMLMVAGELTIQDSGTGGKITTAKAGNVIDVGATEDGAELVGKLTVESGTIENTAQCGIFIRFGSTVIINGGTLKSKYQTIGGNNKTGDMYIEINGGTLTAQYGANIYMANPVSLKITDGTLNGGIGIRMGQIEISGGTINAPTSDTDSPSEYYFYEGNAWLPDALYVYGGTYTAENKTYGNSLNLNIIGGEFNCTNGKGSAVAIYDIGKVAQEASVSISDGEFNTNASDRSAYQVLSLADIGVTKQKEGFGLSDLVGKVNTEISGGVFSSAVDETYCAADYKPLDNGDGTYTVYIPATGLSLPETETATYGTDLKLTATTTPSKITNAVKWESSDTDVATVSGGVVTPVKAGKTTITASVDGLSATCEVTVEKAETDLTLTASPATLEGGGTVTLTVGGDVDAENVTVQCSDTSITVTPGSDGTFTATLPNATVNYTFTATLDDAVYEAEPAEATVSVTRYVAATTGAATTSTTTTTTGKTVTTDVADTDDDTTPAETAEETEPAVEIVSQKTETDPETGTVTTTTEKSDGSTTVVEEQTDGTVTTTDTTAEGAVKSVEEKPDGTITTTDTAVNGVEAVTVEAPGQQVTAKVTIPEEVESAVVTIPVSGELTAGMVAMDADTGEIIMLSALTEDGLALKLDSSRNIVIVDNSKSFDDVAAGNWASDGVAYATAHNLFNGKSEDSFDPDGDMTRSMLMTVLARFDGQDTDAGSTWDEVGMNWAIERGITDGSNPDGSITREQLATMLYRYAGSPHVDSVVAGYSDAGNVSSYAADAMAWAVGSGIITGNTKGELNPDNNSTRSQVATMLMRFGQTQVK